METEVKIKLWQLQKLKDDLNHLQEENERLKNRLEEIDEQAMNEKALKLANEMFSAVIGKTIEKLGFKNISNDEAMFSFRQLNNRLGERFFDSEKIDVEIGIKFTNLIKEAFIRLLILK